MNRFWEGREEKICCIKCNKCRKFKNPKISYTFDKTLAVFVMCDKCDTNDKKASKEE